MEELLSLQHQLMDGMQQVIKNFKKDGSERKTPSHIKRRLESLDQYWKEFQENHIKLCESEKRDYTYFSERHYEQASAFYTENRRIIQKYQGMDADPRGLLRPGTPLGGMEWQQPEKRQSPLTVPGTPTEPQQLRSENQSNLPSTLKVDKGNPSKLDEMYRKQKSNIKALERALNAINLDSLTEKWEFDDALRTIQGRWNAVDSLHWDIDSELTMEDVNYENTYYTFEDRYNQIKKSINSKMWAVSHQEHSTPKLEIPVFSGSYQQWTCFKDLFTESIHKSRTISDAQKMQYLKSKIRGEAERLIQHLPISSENYSTCWDILNHRYNNKRMIFSSHINVLLSLPTINHQSAFALKKLHDTTKECLNAVKNLGVNISTWDPLIVHILIQKVDTETHNDYFEYLEDPRDLPTLSDFLTFLEMRFTALESSRRKQETPKTNQQSQMYDNKKPNNNKYQSGSSKPFINYTNAKTFQPTTSRNKTPPCALCNEQHGIYHCKTFLEQSPEAKRKTVSKLNLCENCLYDHDGKDCFSEKRCVHCKRNHNTLLHESYLSSNKASQQASNVKQSLQKHVSHVSQECVAEILLATAQIKVQAADGSLITMRALIDQGSQTSLITENAAQTLGLPRQRCKGVIFGIGTKENNCKGVINITATAIHTDYSFSTDVIIMKNLVNNLPNRTFNKPVWDHLESIQLADPDFNISRPVDILLEAAVKSLKFHLRRVIGDQKLTYEELSTLLSQLEAVLNSRPLCALSEDINDINYLTPSHFLASGPTLTIVETERDERTRWQLVQKIFADVWKRWQSEYLCKLQSRSKWQQKRENPHINDVIIINDANLPPGKWALGRITKLHPGKDGFVRVVSIKTKNGVIKRPITKISTLVPSSTPSIDKNTKESDTTPGIKTRKMRNKPVCNLVTLALMLILTVLSPAQCAYNILKLRNNQSIYLDKLSNMHFITDQWKLIVYYDMEPYWQGMSLLDKYYKNLENICSSVAKQTKCEIVLHQLRYEATELEYYNNILLGQQFTRAERKRRGLFNAVGYAAHSMFGLLDEESAQKYEKDIDMIKENQKHLALLWKNQTSVVEAEYNLLKRVEESMSKQQTIFNQHISELEKATNAIAKHLSDIEIINEFMLSTLITNSILLNLKDIQETLLDTITNIQYGKFNIHLLTPEQLRQELNIISGQLAKHLSLPIDNIQTNLPSIYHLLKVKARMTSKYFIFEIQIPLISRDSYEIYKLIAIPQQVGREMVRIKPTADYLAISILKDSYIPLSENEERRCISYDSDTQLCLLQKPIFNMKSDDHLCIKNQNNNECEVDTEPCKNNWFELSKINTYLYFCCEQCTIRIICEHQVTAKQLSKAGIITLGDGCTIKDENITILAHKQQLTNFKMKPDLEEISIAPINDVINLSIPIKVIQKTDQTDHEQYKQRLLNIGQDIDQMKKSASNIVLSSTMSHHDIHQYAVMYTILGAVILVAILYAGRRLRRRCSARLPPAPLSERSLGLSAHFTNNEPRMELSRASQLSQLQEPIHKVTITTSNPSTSALDKATSPQTRKRFSECE